ncbi:MAG: glycosyltransferase [bacterium]|jgi:hypothetical protein|nr:glycosyltransferase family 2 protein [Phycisphaerales bacterium]MCE2652544.1 glycosyltransferase family 2 protein [Planctomycetaceae bacterium]
MPMESAHPQPTPSPPAAQALLGGPRVGYVVPAFIRDPAGAQWLHAALRSLRDQREPRWQAVVIDDGSPLPVCLPPDLAGDRRIGVHRTANGGTGAARNLGLALLSTPWVCFADADDLLEPEHAGTLADLLHRHPFAEAAVGGWRAMTADGQPTQWLAVANEQDAAADRLLTGNRFAIWATLWRREALARVRRADAAQGPFRTRCKVEDWALWLDVLGARDRVPVVCTSAPLVRYRIGAPASRSADLTGVHGDALALASEHARATPPDLRDRAARLCRLRALAEGLARSDRAFARQQAEAIWPAGCAITDSDLAALAAALRWSLFAADGGHRPSAHDLRQRIDPEGLAMLGPEAIDRLVCNATRQPVDWASLATAQWAALGPDRRLVVYGLGVNGRAAAEGVDAVRRSGRARPGPALAFMDDRPLAGPPGWQRLTPDQLGPADVVLVTPEDNVAILRRLGESRAGRVVAA